jgi:hypothetical protein
VSRLAREKVDSQKIMELYNVSGSKAAMEFINTKYNIAYPRCVVSRLRKDPANRYDKSKDKFLCLEKTPFLELDELCATSDSENGIDASEKDPIFNGKNIFDWNPDTSFNRIFQELAMEKLLELMKYISLNHATGNCRINKKALDSAGYHVEIF